MSSKMNFSSWRVDMIEVEANGVTDFSFYDTKPNMFYIKNPNNTPLYFSMKNIPTAKKYEFEIKANSYDAFGQPNGTGHLYILNPSENNVIIECYSIFDDFNMSLLKNYSVAFDKLSVEGEMALKAGENLIGAVNLGTKDSKSLLDSKDFLSRMVIPIGNLVSNTSKSGYKNIYDVITELQKIYNKNDSINTLLVNIKGILSNQEKTEMYVNNSSNLLHTATANCRVHFDLLCIGNGVATVSINGTSILTLPSNETFQDLSFDLLNGNSLLISCSGENVLNAKYWIE